MTGLFLARERGSLLNLALMAKHLDVGTFPEKRQGEIEKVLQECGRRFADTQFDSNGQGWEIISEREVLEEATRPFIALSPTTVRAETARVLD